MKADATLARHVLQDKLLQPGQLPQAGNAPTKMTNEQARAAAVQFEALLVQTMLKSMRDASAGNSLFSSEQESMYTDMFDQQISSEIAGSRSMGLAESIYRQIAPDARDTGIAPTAPMPMPARSNVAAAQPTAMAVIPADANHATDEREFIAAIRPAASATARQLGTTVEAVMAVAALESGWGNRMPLKADGSLSHNLFGIKADAGWRGDSTSAATTEFADGEFSTTRASFRSYRNSTESIADFGAFIRDNPRYHKALQNAGDPEQFIREIHNAGYATDPQYANKLTDILHSIQALNGREQI